MEDEKPRIIGSKVLRGGASSAAAAPPSQPPPARRPGVVSGEDFEAKQTANKVIADAHAKAAEILAQAEQDKEKVFAEAREAAKAEVVAQQSEELLKTKMQIGQMIKDLEPQIVELALRIANKIVGRDLERDPMIVAEIAATAIETARASKALVLRVNPKDGATLRAHKSKLMELIGRTIDVSIRDDADVQVGGCVIQTEFGTIDGQIKTQYDMLWNALLPDTAKSEGPK